MEYVHRKYARIAPMNTHKMFREAQHCHREDSILRPHANPISEGVCIMRRRDTSRKTGNWIATRCPATGISSGSTDDDFMAHNYEIINDIHYVLFVYRTSENHKNLASIVPTPNPRVFALWLGLFLVCRPKHLNISKILHASCLW